LHWSSSVVYKAMKNVQFCGCHHIENVIVKFKYNQKRSWTNAQMSLKYFIQKHLCYKKMYALYNDIN